MDEINKIYHPKRVKFGRYENRELLNYGLDLMKAKIWDKGKKSKIRKLGLSENSPIFWYDSETYIELQIQEISPKYDWYFTIKDKKSNATLCFILIAKMGKLGAVRLNDIYEVTGQGFALRDVNYYLDFLKWSGYEVDKFTRIDLYMDLMNTTHTMIRDTLIPRLKDTKKTWTPIIKKGEYETLYIGEKNKQKNTYQLIRVYNKLIDNKFKGKQWLYPDYGTKKIPKVTRVEIELRRDKAKFFTTDNIKSNDYIFSVFVKTVYPLNYKFFGKFYKEKFEKVDISNLNLKKDREYKQKKRYDMYIKYGLDFLDDSDKQKTIGLFRNCCKKLYKNKYSVARLKEMLDNYINCDLKKSIE